ncbi:MAG: hypothetical protein OXC65_02215 [Thiotrichales bacterium]|nr:hypothetical protein [Thiotrichales bacterium]
MTLEAIIFAATASGSRPHLRQRRKQPSEPAPRAESGAAGSDRIVFDSDSHLTPTLEPGSHPDGGDAETGLGVELGGGMAWVHPTLGLSLDLSAARRPE